MVVFPDGSELFSSHSSIYLLLEPISMGFLKKRETINKDKKEALCPCMYVLSDP